MVFLKIYIKVFQQGSDLVEAVEDKILVGDRPKPTNDIESKIPLEERLAKRKPEEIDEVYMPSSRILLTLLNYRNLAHASGVCLL